MRRLDALLPVASPERAHAAPGWGPTTNGHRVTASIPPPTRRSMTAGMARRWRSDVALALVVTTAFTGGSRAGCRRRHGARRPRVLRRSGARSWRPEAGAGVVSPCTPALVRADVRSGAVSPNAQGTPVDGVPKTTSMSESRSPAACRCYARASPRPLFARAASARKSASFSFFAATLAHPSAVASQR